MSNEIQIPSYRDHVQAVLDAVLQAHDIQVRGVRAAQARLLSNLFGSFAVDLLDKGGEFLVQVQVPADWITGDVLQSAGSISLIWAKGARDLASLMLGAQRVPGSP